MSQFIRKKLSEEITEQPDLDELSAEQRENFDLEFNKRSINRICERAMKMIHLKEVPLQYRLLYEFGHEAPTDVKQELWLLAKIGTENSVLKNSIVPNHDWTRHFDPIISHYNTRKLLIDDEES